MQTYPITPDVRCPVYDDGSGRYEGMLTAINNAVARHVIPDKEDKSKKRDDPLVMKRDNFYKSLSSLYSDDPSPAISNVVVFPHSTPPLEVSAPICKLVKSSGGDLDQSQPQSQDEYDGPRVVKMVFESDNKWKKHKDANSKSHRQRVESDEVFHHKPELMCVTILLLMLCLLLYTHGPRNRFR